MATHSLANCVRDRIRAFADARGGNVLTTFALLSIPLVAMMGAAIDYSRANRVKTDLQAALDSTALMISKNAPMMTSDELQTAAKNYFEALFKNRDAASSNITISYDASKSTVNVNGTGQVHTDFIGILGHQFDTLPITGTSSVSWGNSRLRVALALDNTGSMASNNKMTALKSAAKNLLTQLQSAALKNGDVYVSIVPFAKDVNVGNGNYSATWLNWTAWDQANGSNTQTCTTTTTTSTGGNNNNNGNGNGNGGNGNGNGHNGGSTCTTAWTAANHNTWNGCVTDRDQDYDTMNTTPDTTRVPTLFVAEQYSTCPTAMMPLSYDWTALKNKIDAMQSNGNTNVTIGLSLAWQSLTTGAPFSPPAEDANYKYQKVIVLLTDGDNTQNRFTSTQADIDARTKKACDNAKAAGVTIYTVLVMQGSQSLLQNCASDANKFFYLQSASELVTAFNQIGTDLTNLRVSR